MNTPCRIVTENAGAADDPAPWVYDILDGRGRPLPGAWDGWYRTEAEAVDAARAWLAAESLTCAAL